MSNYLHEKRCAEALARQASYILDRGRRGDIDITLKGVNDLVTEIDLRIEKFLVRELERLFPDDAILGEEFGANESDNTCDRIWYIDPVDGTHNLSREIPFSCISIGLHVDGSPKVGIVLDPYRSELFSASEEESTRLNGKKVSTSQTEDIANSTVATGFPRNDPDITDKNTKHFERMATKTRGIRRMGAAALDLCYVAAGRTDAFWEYGLSPWDTAAGILLVQNAGGQVTTIPGDEYNLRSDSILATNETLHSEMEGVLNSDS